MEHQVFVPVQASALRTVLRAPTHLARCVPGLQHDAGSAPGGPLGGRLRLRVGGNTVTYRGALTLTEQDEDTFTIDGEGTEARGTGTVKFALTLRLAPAEDGTRLDFSATATADGRAAAFDPEALATAVHRLLDRASAKLSATATAAPEAQDPDGAQDPGHKPNTGTDTDTNTGTGTDTNTGTGTEPPSVFDAEVPPPSLDPSSDPSSDPSRDRSHDPFREDEFPGGFGEPVRPPAEAAHARRTMIGRSAEEVDHAPPRGRYAPVPAPDATVPGASLRWLAPAAALALAGAVVVGRALRRRT
ncbi:SRPBCC family protein [Streptomyces sp. NPDC089799]|uniref:SRPBCC family protein n=1 Tax=Streptomyces sp. NPDC089799 TaxID=3155066 RepID=UPI003419E1E9